MFSLSDLRVLDVEYNDMVGPIDGIQKLTELRHLKLAYNDFEGELPDLSSLIHIRTIELHGNDLTGDIPNALCTGHVTISVDPEITCPTATCCDGSSYSSLKEEPTPAAAQTTFSTGSKLLAYILLFIGTFYIFL